MSCPNCGEPDVHVNTYSGSDWCLADYGSINNCPNCGTKLPEKPQPLRWAKTNISNSIKLKLTPSGRASLVRREFASRIDGEGWITLQIHDLMSIFGQKIFLGCTMPFETEVMIEVKP